MKLDFKSIAANSLAAEEQAVKNKFDMADQLLGQQKEEQAPRVPVPKPRAEKPKEKPKAEAKPKEKVIRDIFSLPESEYELIDNNRIKCARAGFMVNKSEVIRLSLHALNQVKSEDLVALIEKLPKLRGKRKRTTKDTV